MRLFAGTPFDRPPSCEHCGASESECRCPQGPAARLAPASQTVRLGVEKRRKGKTVTTIRGLSSGKSDLAALLSRLKSQCGAGGAIQDDALEIQGDHLQRLAALLSELGYRVKT